MEHAIAFSETGHLYLVSRCTPIMPTRHWTASITSSPKHRRAAIADELLASNLKAIVSQRLVRSEY